MLGRRHHFEMTVQGGARETFSSTFLTRDGVIGIDQIERDPRDWGRSVHLRPNVVVK